MNSSFSNNLNKFTRKKTNSPIKKWTKDMNRHLSKEGIYASNKHMKKGHYYWSLKKYKSKPHWDTVSHQLEWQSLKYQNNRCWRECEGTGTIVHCWRECKLVQLLWKTVWWFLKDLEIEIPFDPAIPLLDIYPKDYKLFYYKDTWTRMFIMALFPIWLGTKPNAHQW